MLEFRIRATTTYYRRAGARIFAPKRSRLRVRPTRSYVAELLDDLWRHRTVG